MNRLLAMALVLGMLGLLLSGCAATPVEGVNGADVAVSGSDKIKAEATVSANIADAAATTATTTPVDVTVVATKATATTVRVTMATTVQRLKLTVTSPLFFEANDPERYADKTLSYEDSKTFAAILNRQVVDRLAYKTSGEYLFVVGDQYFSLNVTEGWLNLLDADKRAITRSISLSGEDAEQMRALFGEYRLESNDTLLQVSTREVGPGEQWHSYMYSNKDGAPYVIERRVALEYLPDQTVRVNGWQARLEPRDEPEDGVEDIASVVLDGKRFCPVNVRTLEEWELSVDELERTPDGEGLYVYFAWFRRTASVPIEPERLLGTWYCVVPTADDAELYETVLTVTKGEHGLDIRKEYRVYVRGDGTYSYAGNSYEKTAHMAHNFECWDYERNRYYSVLSGKEYKDYPQWTTACDLYGQDVYSSSGMLTTLVHYEYLIESDQLDGDCETADGVQNGTFSRESPITAA